MTDSRLKHTEMKSDISKLLEKIDSLNTKVQKLADGDNGSRQQMLTQAPEMEAMVIMQNVSRIMKVLIISQILFQATWQVDLRFHNDFQ